MITNIEGPCSTHLGVVYKNWAWLRSLFVLHESLHNPLSRSQLVKGPVLKHLGLVKSNSPPRAGQQVVDPIIVRKPFRGSLVQVIFLKKNSMYGLRCYISKKLGMMFMRMNIVGNINTTLPKLKMQKIQ